MSSTPSLPPEILTAVPGPRSRALAARLAASESRNVTALMPDPPIFWHRAHGSNVWDVDGNRYVDLGAGFGVAQVGHAHPRVVDAIARQSGELVHAMGDVHPAAVKVELLEALAARFPAGVPARTVLGSSGSDAVEIALKTALLATGRPGIVSFEGAYHGLTFGALEVTWRAAFRKPFESRLHAPVAFACFGDADDVLRAARSLDVPVGAVIVEPVQGRGGERIPPHGFLRRLREICDRSGWQMIVDEVYTGFGRTGRMFACDHEGVVPDLLCVGKGLASGMPISACIGRRESMDCWPPSDGEALHTQTFLGHPPGCAAALASLSVIDDEGLVARAATTGGAALARLRIQLAGHAGIREVRGLGLLLAIECDHARRALDACNEVLRRGVICLPSGDDGRVIALTPPLSIEPAILEHALDLLVECLA